MDPADENSHPPTLFIFEGEERKYIISKSDNMVLLALFADEGKVHLGGIDLSPDEAIGMGTSLIRMADRLTAEETDSYFVTRTRGKGT